MKPIPTFAAAALALAFTAGAQAHGSVKCEPVAKADMQPHAALQKDLTDKGWRVRRVKNYNGCYEVYGFDDKGAKVEAFFDPKTLDRVEPKN